MESEESVEIDHLVAGNVDGWTHCVVCLLGVGYDDIQAVGRAALENDDQTFILRCRRLGSVGGASEK